MGKNFMYKRIEIYSNFNLIILDKYYKHQKAIEHCYNSLYTFNQ